MKESKRERERERDRETETERERRKREREREREREIIPVLKCRSWLHLSPCLLFLVFVTDVGYEPKEWEW